MKTMLKVGLGMLLAAGSAYVHLPQLREAIVALAPTLVLLLCPISMLACMWTMRRNRNQACQSQGGKYGGMQAQAPVKANESTPEQFAAFVKRDAEKYREIIKDINYSPN